MKLAFLDIKTIGEDLDLSIFEDLGEVVKYSFTAPDEVAKRAEDKDVIVVNKIPVNETTIGGAKNLKLVCVTATGTDNLDKEYLAKRGIEWRNVAGYSTESVAQHTFAMLFYLMENLRYYDDYVKDEHYVNDTMFTHFGKTFHELSSMTWGIIGLGNIGRRVADLAKMFGAKVIYFSPSGREAQDGYTKVDFDILLKESDIISVHSPLNEFTRGLMDEEAFQKMKKGSIFLNLARGPIVDEAALTKALEEEWIMAAGLDVLTKEPMSVDNPLLKIKDSGKLLITPHIAWAGIEARTRLMHIIKNQILQWQKERK